VIDIDYLTAAAIGIAREWATTCCRRRLGECGMRRQSSASALLLAGVREIAAQGCLRKRFGGTSGRGLKLGPARAVWEPGESLQQIITKLIFKTAANCSYAAWQRQPLEIKWPGAWSRNADGAWNGRQRVRLCHRCRRSGAGRRVNSLRCGGARMPGCHHRDSTIRAPTKNVDPRAIYLPDEQDAAHPNDGLLPIWGRVIGDSIRHAFCSMNWRRLQMPVLRSISPGAAAQVPA